MKLIKPSKAFQASYLKMLEDWNKTGEDMVPFSLKYETNDFDAFIKKNEYLEIHPETGFVCHSTFWLINEKEEVVGTSNIRHELNENLLIEGGHIGYGISPSYRRMGYATKILALSLKEAKKLGIEKALITCDKINIGSKKTILRNGGVFRSEDLVDGELNLSFWIDNL